MNPLSLALLAMPKPDELPAGGAPAAGPNMMLLLLPLLLVFLLMPLFNKKDKKRRLRVTGLKKHDKVVTTGGILGTVTSLDNDIVVLEVDKDVRIRVKRSSVLDVQGAGEGQTPETAGQSPATRS